MITRPSWVARARHTLFGPDGPGRPPRVQLEDVRTVPLLVLRVVAVLLVAGAYALLGPAVITWFVLGPLLVSALVPGGTWAVLVGVTIVGGALAAGDPGLRPAALALLLPAAVHLSLLADAASRSDLRDVGVDVRLVGRALRSTVLVGCVVVPLVALLALVDTDLPGWLGVLGAVGVVGLGAVAVRLTSSSRAR